APARVVHHQRGGQRPPRLAPGPGRGQRRRDPRDRGGERPRQPALRHRLVATRSTDPPPAPTTCGGCCVSGPAWRVADGPRRRFLRIACESRVTRRTDLRPLQEISLLPTVRATPVHGAIVRTA